MRALFLHVDLNDNMLYNISMIFANVRKNLYSIIAYRGLLVGLLVIFVFMLALGISPAASAACDINNMSIASGADCAQGNGQPSQLVGTGGIFNRITSILLFVVGAVAVIMLIFGGIRYIVSGGDQNNVTAAKNTILYAIIGIIVALLAYAAVKFVTTSLVSGMV